MKCLKREVMQLTTSFAMCFSFVCVFSHRKPVVGHCLVGKPAGNAICISAALDVHMELGQIETSAPWGGGWEMAVAGCIDWQATARTTWANHHAPLQVQHHHLMNKLGTHNDR